MGLMCDEQVSDEHDSICIKIDYVRELAWKVVAFTVVVVVKSFIRVSPGYTIHSYIKYINNDMIMKGLRHYICGSIFT